MSGQTNIEIIQELLLEFKIHRNAIMQMIDDLEEIKKNVNKLLPAKLDARYARFLEEKIKTITELFKTLLDMRKEIQKSIREEIELRNKIDLGEDKEKDLEKHLDIRKLAEKVEEFKETREKFKKSTIVKSQEETDQATSEVVQITESG